MKVLGIDVGGSGIKGALVNVETGEMTTKRVRIDTPQPSTPEAVVEVIRKIVKQFKYKGPLGVGFPAVVIDGIVMSAANVDKSWIGYPGAKAIAKATGCEVTVLNDADVAGVAEMYFGAGRHQDGVVMIFTLGTGIGSVMFVNGRVVPNLELGHVYMPNQPADQDAEFLASSRAKTEENLSWEEWGGRLNDYFNLIERLFSPQLIIIGGGVSKDHADFLHYIKVRAKVIPAQLRNEAGIVGAALVAVKRHL